MRFSESESLSPSSSDEHDRNTSIQTGIGLSNPHLFQRERVMLDLINRLHNTGVQVDMDLPQIAVIGQQSAGKSSVIEAISGITLPRSSGTCTRCPTECRLSRSESPWKCIVSLRFTSSSQSQVRNEDFGPVIYDKTEVEERIRRAQRAILNPSKPSKQFLVDTDGNQDSELSFSSNCVSLQISGPDVADLSFCDLPGLIATVSSSRGGGNDDIGLVESLVTSYIKKPSCIILLTVTCETDFENQGANRLTKLHDPEGKRTVGVLTKPDRIPSGEAGNWLAFIRNEKEPLANGWYAVKQPGSQAIERGITWEEAREEEDRFFATESGWCDLDSIHHKYLRTSNLVARLSEILSDLISKRLPEIHNELEKTISQARERLSKLPKAPSSDPINDICALIYAFTTDLARHVEGVADQDGLIQAIRPAYEKFRKAIRSTAPNFQPFEEKLKAKKRLGSPPFLSNEEGVDGVSEIKEEVLEENPIYIDAVMERAHQARTRELPDHYPFVIQQTFIDAVIKKWNTPTMDLCRTVHKLVSEHVQKLVNQHFGKFGQGYLEKRVRGILQQHVTQCQERAEERISWLLALEDRPFTMNTHYLTDYRNKFLGHYKAARELHEHSELIRVIELSSSAQAMAVRGFPGQVNTQYAAQPTGVVKVLAGLVEIGMNGIKPEDLAKLLPPDKMEPALAIMADVRAYFQVAYKRFVDNIPLAIDLELVRGLERGVHSALYAQVGVSGPDAIIICQRLAGESPAVARDRADLLKKLERLESASKELLYFGV